MSSPTDTESRPEEWQERRPEPERRAGELTFRELLRFGWRQLTSMRTALVLLLLLALAAVPGSLIPQQGVDSLKTSNWKDAHPGLTPVYERLHLFEVYGSPWFSAIYLLLMISLVGCILPRTLVYWRGMRSQPPAAPRNLARLPDHASYVTDEDPAQVIDRARAVLGRRRYRVRAVHDGEEGVSAERGYLREAGNLVFHVSVLVVLVGFGIGSLFGYKGGVILTVGNTFANTPTQYDDLVPGSLFTQAQLDPFSFTVNKFDINWLDSGPRAGMATGFGAEMTYQEAPGSPVRDYDLRVNHPLTIGSTELFLIGHGYSPEITVKDGNGDIAYTGPTIFLPQDTNFLSFGVVKAAFAQPTQIGLEGLFYPTAIPGDKGMPTNLMGQANNPVLSLRVFTGDLNMGSGESQSVYVLDKSGATQLTKPDGMPLNLVMGVGDTTKLPDNLGSVTFDGVKEWNKIQISQTPGKRIALGGVILALLGLLGSLFIRPRRVWVRARREGGGTLVEMAALDRSGGGDVASVLDDLLVDLQADRGASRTDRST